MIGQLGNGSFWKETVGKKEKNKMLSKFAKPNSRCIK